MSLRYLLDTNILSEPVRKRPSLSVLKQLEHYREQVSTASVVWHEMWFGCQRLAESRKRQAIESYLANVVRKTVPLLSYDAESATWHAAERARLGELGQTPPFVDGQIAAIAHTNNLILVTRNISDYAGFSDLSIENWYDLRN